MIRCAYCKTENRTRAIFCRHCRRPLRGRRALKILASSYLLLWLLGLSILLLVAFSVYSSRSFLRELSGPDTPSPTAAVPTRTRAPVTRGDCVREPTRIRRGPGTGYETTGGLLSGTCLTILGRNEEGSWVFIVSKDGQTGWVDASLLANLRDLNRISVRDDSRRPNRSRPTLTSAEVANGAQAYLTQVAATNIAAAPLSRYIIPCFQTAGRIGDYISCRMERAHCDYLPTDQGSSTVCSDRPPPDHTFALLVFGKDWSNYEGQCLIVSGYLQVDHGALVIQALDRSQVSTCS